MKIKNLFSIKPELKKRLSASFESINCDFTRLKSMAATQEEPWVVNVSELLEKTRKAVNYNHIDEGWNLIHIIEENMVFGMNDEEIKSRAESIRDESIKIKGFRQMAICNLLGKSGQEITIIPREKLAEAIRLRNDHHNLKYHKINLRKVSINFLALIMTLLVSSIIALSLFFDPTNKLEFWQETIAVVVLGSLGACFSMTHSSTTLTLDDKIPEQVLGSFISIIRLGAGATSAFIAVLIMRTGILKNIVNEDLLTSPYSYLIIAFISGFSERWITNIIKAVSNTKEVAEDKKKGRVEE